LKVTYQFVTGEKQEIEIDERTYQEIKELDRQEYNNNQRERRRHCSADRLRDEFDFELQDTADTLDEFLQYDTWQRYLQQLNDRQKDLVRRVFFNGEKITDIARDLGKSFNTIKESLEGAIKKIKKLLD